MRTLITFCSGSGASKSGQSRAGVDADHRILDLEYNAMTGWELGSRDLRRAVTCFVYIKKKMCVIIDRGLTVVGWLQKWPQFFTSLYDLCNMTATPPIKKQSTVSPLRVALITHFGQETATELLPCQVWIWPPTHLSNPFGNPVSIEQARVGCWRMRDNIEQRSCASCGYKDQLIRLIHQLTIEARGTPA